MSLALKHRLTQISPHRSKYALLVFVLNEGDRIRNQLVRLKPYTKLVDIIVVDGGSTDGSLNPQFLKNHQVVTLLTLLEPGGLSAQMRLGLAFALDQKYHGFIVMDGNNKDDPKAIPEFIDKLNQGFDHVQGSRYIKGGRGVHTPFWRHLGVRLLHAPLISLASGVKYTDTTNGFRAYSPRLLFDKRVQPFRSVFINYRLHYYLAIRAGQLGFKTIEIPVTRSYPKGKVPTKIKSFKGKLQILNTLFQAVSGAWNPH